MGNGSFAPDYVEKLRLHPSIGWALAQIGEARGFQEVWRKTKPEIIAKLRESALVQSAESLRVVDAGSEASHIPLEEYKFFEFWKANEKK